MNYSDNIDQASEIEQMERDHLIAKARRAAALRHPFTGHCLFCDSDVRSPKIFCDAECADMHEKQRQAHIRNGLKL